MLLFPPRSIPDRTVTKSTALVRRASVCGIIGRTNNSTTTSADRTNTTSLATGRAERINTTSLASGRAERISAQAKLSMARRVASGIAARSINTPITTRPPNSISASATAHLSSTQKMQRRISSPAMLTPNVSSSMTSRPMLRKSVGVTNTTAIPSKIARK